SWNGTSDRVLGVKTGRFAPRFGLKNASGQVGEEVGQQQLTAEIERQVHRRVEDQFGVGDRFGRRHIGQLGERDIGIANGASVLEGSRVRVPRSADLQATGE